ncbi:MAG: hypothetical protein ACOX3T_03275 [Bdellovibrionota bacterium]
MQFFITKSLRSTKLTKEYIRKDKVKFTIYFSESDSKSYTVEKNENNAWQVVDVPYSLAKGTLGKVFKQS